MMDNSFEKQIAEKMNRMEVRVPDTLLDSVFEKRAARRKKYAGFGTLVFAVSVAVLGLAGLAYYMQQHAADNTEAHKQVQAQLTEEAGNATIQEGLKVTKDSEPENTEAQGRRREPLKYSGADKAVEHSVYVNKLKDDKRKVIRSGSFRDRNIVSAGHSISEMRGPKTGEAAAISGFTADDYFNLSSPLRPEITYEQHVGNSHLYVYESYAGDQNQFVSLVHSRPSRMNLFPNFYTFDACAPVQAKSKAYSPRSNAGKPLFADILFMPSWNMHSSAASGEYAEMVNGLSISSYNSQFGIRLSVPLQNNLSVFSGLFYKAHSNQYKGDIVYFTDASRIETRISYINDPVKGVIQVTTFDTIAYRAENKQGVNHRNTYTLLQLPLGMSYNFGYKGFDFAFHGSALINAFIRSSGQALDMETHSSAAFSASKPFFGLGAGLGFMAAAKISPRFRLIAEPGIQYYGIRSSAAGNSSDERSLNSSFSIGLRYTVF